ncbi:MAG: thiamine diphosphokinase [Clostridia bacterium]
MLKNGKSNRCVILTAIGITKKVINLAGITSEDLVIAADGGIDFAIKYGVKVDLYIGDKDSAICKKTSVEEIVYKAEKDDTDTMLAIQKGLEQGYKEFLILGGTGGRLSHTISNMQCLKYIKNNNASGKIISSDGEILYLKNEEITLFEKCSYFSVITFNEKATGITIENAKYNMKNGSLTNSYPLGISNEFINKQATISVLNGEIYIIIEK